MATISDCGKPETFSHGATAVRQGAENRCQTSSTVWVRTYYLKSTASPSKRNIYVSLWNVIFTSVLDHILAGLFACPPYSPSFPSTPFGPTFFLRPIPFRLPSLLLLLASSPLPSLCVAALPHFCLVIAQCLCRNNHGPPGTEMAVFAVSECRHSSIKLSALRSE